MSDDAARLLSGEAWRAFCDRLAGAGQEILDEAYPSAPRARAEGYRSLTRLLVYALQQEVEAGDPRFPSFVRHQDPHNQWGGPNPDNVYLRAAIDPAMAYRIRADVTGVRQLIVSLHEGDMPLGEYGVYHEHSLDRFQLGPGGRLEIAISPEPQPGNWIPMHPKARLVTLRIYQSDWERDAAPPFHIERIGAEGVPRPPLDPGELARALERAAVWVERSIAYWNRYTSEGWKRATPNAVTPAAAALGGADNILYGSCFWELAPDEALLLECEAPDADYWGFTNHTLPWLESGDFAERQTSLNGQQLHLDSDGRVRIVVSHADPGTPNWLDTEGRPRGLLVYRWVWARTRPVPTALHGKLAALRERLPADHPALDPTARRASLARRRAAAWTRLR